MSDLNDLDDKQRALYYSLVGNYRMDDFQTECICFHFDIDLADTIGMYMYKKMIKPEDLITSYGKFVILISPLYYLKFHFIYSFV